MITQCLQETDEAVGVSAHQLWSAHRSVRRGCTGTASDRKRKVKKRIREKKRREICSVVFRGFAGKLTHTLLRCGREIRPEC